MSIATLIALIAIQSAAAAIRYSTIELARTTSTANRHFEAPHAAAPGEAPGISDPTSETLSDVRTVYASAPAAFCVGIHSGAVQEVDNLPDWNVAVKRQANSNTFKAGNKVVRSWPDGSCVGSTTVTNNFAATDLDD